MRDFTVGRVFGIPLKIDLTFLLVLPVLAWLISTQIGAYTSIFNGLLGANLAVGPLTAGPMPWVLGFVAAIGLFVGVLLHELGHSLVAIRYGYEIESIRLWFLGGLAQFVEMPEDWRQELTVAIAGPIVSVLVGLVSLGGFYLVPTGELTSVRFVLSYLGVLNIGLAAFNLLPGFPMDGGRVLRALLARTRPHAQATQTAARVGQAFAVGLALLGVFGGGSIFLIVIALFIYISASSESQQTTMKAAFEGILVRDIMTEAEAVHSVGPKDSIATLLDRMLRERHTGYPVLDGDRLVGIVTLSDARNVREVERDAYRVEEVMTRNVMTTAASSEAMTAMNTMQSNGIGRLPVIDADGDIAGLISRTDVMTALNIIQSSGVERNVEDATTGRPRRPDPDETLR